MNGATKLKACLIVSIFLLGMACTAAAGRTIYVDADALGANDGSSWADAYNYLQDALTDANSALKPIEISVAEGIYKPDSNSADPGGSGDREATFQLINGVTLKGGYAGFGEPDPNAWDVELYETILSGDLNGNDIDLNDPYDLLNEPSRAENSYHVLTGSGTGSNTVLDGFTITGGYANMNPPHGAGAGMYNDHGNIIIRNCTFSGNMAYYGGGGIYNYGSRLDLLDCSFEGNLVSENYGGGGIDNYRSKTTLTNCTFIGNSAGSGGGVSNSNSKTILRKCIFTGNSAEWGGGMGNGYGSTKLSDCIFVRNLASENGGGMGSIQYSTSMTNCTFVDNCAERGGGIYNGVYRPKLTNCTFIRNLAFIDGGGMWNSGTPSMTSCTFTGNSAERYGGGMCNWYNSAGAAWCVFSGNSAGESGGGMYNKKSNTILTNSVLAGNFAVHGGGLASDSPDSPSHFQGTNCILWGNIDSGVEDKYEQIYGGTSYVNYSCIQGGWPGEGNIDTDPCFADFGYWDPNGTPVDANDDFWIQGDYHLKSQAGRWDANEGRWTKDEVTSPCIDAGDPMSPIGLEPFPNSGRINMGAYGGTSEAGKSYFGGPVCETIVAGDINGDCKVNFLDFRLMAFHWLEDVAMVNSNAMVDAGIEYYVQTSKPVYTLGENVEMLFRVTNLTGEDVLIPCGRYYEFNFFVKKNGETIWMEIKGWIGLSPGVNILDGESVERGHNWNMKDNNGNPVEPGVYNVVGVMYNGPTEVEVTITIIP